MQRGRDCMGFEAMMFLSTDMLKLGLLSFTFREQVPLLFHWQLRTLVMYNIGVCALYSNTAYKINIKENKKNKQL